MVCLGAFMLALGTQAQVAKKILGERHAMIKLEQGKKYLLLPVEEKEEHAHIRVVRNNQLVKTINCRLAVNNVDYFVPYEIGEGELFDITFNGNMRSTGAINDFTCWKRMTYSDTFDTKNVEKHRPLYHHTPQYGWMNDPNGMFYKDGVWHLCYQFNPYGSQWENLSWGHSTSTDLINWKTEPTALEPDALGMMFSGCCVVDKNNTAGFGKDAIVALYTTAGARQTQSLAYSTDGGKTFTKYADNPIITSNVPDFRDPHVFWNAEAGFWNMILAAGQQMSIYSSKDLKEWKHESDFGAEYGNHVGVWECPDLMKMNVKGTNKDKWTLICNINPGGPFGGSATQYFIGQFDGHKFTCEDEPSETKWMDYGKDHYATITFDNAPEGRHVGIAWMSNWQYANQVPTKQYRSANSIVRDFGLFEYKGETYCSITPAKEMLAARGARVSQPTEACEIVVTVKGDAQITLRNAKGERVVMTYDDEEETFDMDRRRSGNISFSDAFPVATSSPTYGKVRQLRIFVDRCSVEAFDGDGKMCMTNLVFPSTPYDKIIVKGKAKAAIYKIKTQN
ncbi:2,6-beta-D-fructofuranosidase [Prevotella sp. P3-122]|nr:2,6-beta-D-fructofuranosidase [Prevotella sp. P3-122]